MPTRPGVVAVDEGHRAAVAGEVAERVVLDRLEPLLDLGGEVEMTFS
jgi:hypothetical protein